MNDYQDPDQASEDPRLRAYANSEALIRRAEANRDEVAAMARGVKGRGTRSWWAQTLTTQTLATANATLADARANHDALTRHLSEAGVFPDSERGRPETGAAAEVGESRMPDAPERGVRIKSLPTGTLTDQQLQEEDSALFARLEEASPQELKNLMYARSSHAVLAGHTATNTQDLDEYDIYGHPAYGDKQADQKGYFNPGVLAGSGGSPEEGVAGAAARGFVGGASAGIRANLAAGRGQAQGGEARTAPVRNAEGQTLQDLTAQTPGEDALPGTTQPLALDVIDALQGKPGPRIVKNPAHIERLEAIEANRVGGIDRGADGYDR